jgi:glycerophosphoryl diester phosphodiesterase
MVSFSRAAELGADVVEFDVRQTRDNQIAVIHDSFLTDATGQVWPVHQSSLAELQQINLGGGERVPALSEAIKICQERQMGAYIEVKDGGAIPLLVQFLQDSEWATHCLIGSFRADWVAEVARSAPEIPTSVLFSSIHVDPVRLAQSVGARFVHPCWEHLEHPSALLTPEWITSVRHAGLGIIVWHEERTHEIALLRRLGVDGICSDAPELLQAAGDET